MIILGIDTSGYSNAIGVVDGVKTLVNTSCEARTDSLEKIVVNIDEALRSAGLALGDVDGIGVGLGPGSWTGIRVGVTVAKTLAFATGKPVAGVPTLEAMALSAGDVNLTVCPVIDVGAGEAVYAACYRVQHDKVARLGDYYVGDIPGLAALITGPVLVAGRDAARYSAAISRAIDSWFAIGSTETVPEGDAVARLAGERLARGERDDPLALAPLYLKESTARVFVNKYARRAAGKE